MGLAQRAAAAQPLTAAAGMPVQLAVLSQSVLLLCCLRVANLVSAAVLQQRADSTAGASYVGQRWRVLASRLPDQTAPCSAPASPESTTTVCTAQHRMMFSQQGHHPCLRLLWHIQGVGCSWSGARGQFLAGLDHSLACARFTTYLLSILFHPRHV